jgi:PAS domain S-box-containing protein
VKTRAELFEEVERLQRRLHEADLAALEGKRAEEAFQASKARLEFLISASPAVTYVCDAGGSYPATYISENVEAQLGYRARDFTSDPDFWADNIHPEDAPRVMADLTALFETDHHVHEYRFRHKDGHYLWMRDELRLIRDGEGNAREIVGSWIDITERKQAEEALRASEARLAGILAIAPQAIVSIEVNQHICLFNQGAEKIFGYPAEQVLGQPLETLLPPRFRKSHRKQLERFLASPEVSRVMGHRKEIVGLRKDGSEFPAEAAISKLKTGGETIFTVLLQDITERKRAERALRESQQVLHAVIDAVPAMISAKDRDLRYVFMNRYQAGLYGVTPEQAVGKTATELMGRDYGGYTEALDRGVFDSGAPVTNYEEDWRDPTGEEHVLLTTKVSLRDDTGSTANVVTVALDITERKRAENALRESEHTFRSLIDNSPAAIVLKDMEGRFLLANKQFAEWYDVPAHEVFGKSSHDIFPRDYADAYVRQDRDVLREMRVIEREHEMPFADGRIHLVQATKFPVVDSEGRCLGIAAINSDITDQRRAETQLRQAQKMKVLGQLTGGIAHDFNNLLAIILNNAELLLQRLGGDDALAAAVIRATSRGAGLVQRLLAFSRQQSLQPKAINLNELLAGMMDMLRRTLGETIEIETLPAVHLWNTLADQGQVENAVLNLAVNARDAMPRGGRLIIETGNIELDADDTAQHAEAVPGAYVTLSMTDTGTGMSPEALEHVFEPFFTTKPVGKGTGLGLSMVYGFAKQSGGHVTINSEQGRGTTVKLYLPRTRQERREAEQEPILEEPDSRGETILVVEDDTNVRALVGSMLAGRGYGILEAGDGSAALAAMADCARIDLMLIDVVLPGTMNGLELAEEAKRRYPDVKVLFMSGYLDTPILQQANLDQDTELLIKPFLKGALAQRVRAMLDGGPTESGRTNR